MEIRFFRQIEEDYILSEEEFIGKLNSDFLPRKGDLVCIPSMNVSGRVIDVSIFYEETDENGVYVPYTEVNVLAEECDPSAHCLG